MWKTPVSLLWVYENSMDSLVYVIHVSNLTFPVRMNCKAENLISYTIEI